MTNAQLNPLMSLTDRLGRSPAAKAQPRKTPLAKAERSATAFSEHLAGPRKLDRRPSRPSKSSRPAERDRAPQQAAERQDNEPRSRTADKKVKRRESAEHSAADHNAAQLIGGYQPLSLFNPAVSAFAAPSEFTMAGPTLDGDWGSMLASGQATQMFTLPDSPFPTADQLAGAMEGLQQPQALQSQALQALQLKGQQQLGGMAFQAIEEAGPLLTDPAKAQVMLAGSRPNLGLQPGPLSSPQSNKALGSSTSEALGPKSQALGIAPQLLEQQPLASLPLERQPMADGGELSEGLNGMLLREQSVFNQGGMADERATADGKAIADNLSDLLQAGDDELTQQVKQALGGSKDQSGFAKIVAAQRFNQMTTATPADGQTTGQTQAQAQAPAQAPAEAQAMASGDGLFINDFGKSSGQGMSGLAAGQGGQGSSGLGANSLGANGQGASNQDTGGQSTGGQGGEGLAGREGRAEPLLATRAGAGSGFDITGEPRSAGSTGSTGSAGSTGGSQGSGELSPALKQSILSQSIRLAGGGGTAAITLQTGASGPLGVTVAVGGGVVDIQLATADDELSDTLVAETPALLDALKKQLPGQEVAVKVTPAEEGQWSEDLADSQPDQSTFERNDQNEQNSRDQRQSSRPQQAADRPIEQAATRYAQQGRNHNGQLYQRV